MSRRAQVICALAAVLLLGGGALFLWRTGFFAALSSAAGMERYLARFFPFGQCFFFLIQLLSVLIAPIPSNVTALAGAVLFGLWQSFFLTFGAVLLGSFAVFLLARVLGRPFADKLVGKKLSDKYLDTIRTRRDTFLLLVFLLPFFPDDLICILAGLTDIRPLRFFLIVLAARPWGLLVSCAVGSAAISIPLWGMIALGLAGASLLVLGMKYGGRVETWLLARLKRK